LMHFIIWLEWSYATAADLGRLLGRSELDEA